MTGTRKSMAPQHPVEEEIYVGNNPYFDSGLSQGLVFPNGQFQQPQYLQATAAPTYHGLNTPQQAYNGGYLNGEFNGAGYFDRGSQTPYYPPSQNVQSRPSIYYPSQPFSYRYPVQGQVIQAPLQQYAAGPPTIPYYCLQPILHAQPTYEQVSPPQESMPYAWPAHGQASLHHYAPPCCSPQPIAKPQRLQKTTGQLTPLVSPQRVARPPLVTNQIPRQHHTPLICPPQPIAEPQRLQNRDPPQQTTTGQLTPPICHQELIVGPPPFPSQKHRQQHTPTIHPPQPVSGQLVAQNKAPQQQLTPPYSLPSPQPVKESASILQESTPLPISQQKRHPYNKTLPCNLHWSTSDKFPKGTIYTQMISAQGRFSIFHFIPQSRLDRLNRKVYQCVSNSHSSKFFGTFDFTDDGKWRWCSEPFKNNEMKIDEAKLTTASKRSATHDAVDNSSEPQRKKKCVSSLKINATRKPDVEDASTISDTKVREEQVTEPVVNIVVPSSDTRAIQDMTSITNSLPASAPAQGNGCNWPSGTQNTTSFSKCTLEELEWYILNVLPGCQG